MLLNLSGEFVYGIIPYCINVYWYGSKSSYLKYSIDFEKIATGTFAYIASNIEPELSLKTTSALLSKFSKGYLLS